MKASTELDNLIKSSEYLYSKTDDGRHKFAKDGWDYYKTIFDVNGTKFEEIINIAKDGNKKTFYDITQIKRISQNRSTSDKSFSTSLTNFTNSIPQSKEKGNTTTKYSIQKNKNNAGLENNSSSFSLPKNEKLSQNKLGSWESFLERNKINKGTTTTLGELRLPEAKRNLPAVKEIQFQDSVNNARYILKEKEVKMILILIKNWNKKVHIFII